MKKLLLLLISTFALAQNATKNVAGYYSGTTAMVASAIVQFDSTTKGALFPRMTTTQRNAINSPATSLTIFNTTTSRYNFYTGSTWLELATSGSVPTLQQVTEENDTISGSLYDIRLIKDLGFTIIEKATGLEVAVVTKDGIQFKTASTIMAFGAGQLYYEKTDNPDYTASVLQFENPANGDVTNPIVPARNGLLAMSEDIPTTPSQVGALAIDGSNASGTVDIQDSKFHAAGIFIKGNLEVKNPDTGSTVLYIVPEDGTINFTLDNENNFRINDNQILSKATGLAIDGSNANQNIDIGTNRFTARTGGFIDGINTDADITALGSISAKGAISALGVISAGGSLVLTEASSTNNLPDSDDKRYQTDAQQTNNDATSSIQTQLNGKVTQGVNNATTSVLTSAQLNTAYPSATTGFKVYCLGITVGKMTYEKTPSDWIGYTVLVP